MKKTLIWISTISLTLVILVKSGVLSALVIFLLVGAIPGTNHSVPPIIMLAVLAAIASVVAFRFTAVSLIRELRIHTRAQQKARQAERMPKRRFSQI
jgi:uncharacterized protein YybS (DUF2232 family)